MRRQIRELLQCSICNAFMSNSKSLLKEKKTNLSYIQIFFDYLFLLYMITIPFLMSIISLITRSK